MDINLLIQIIVANNLQSESRCQLRKAKGHIIFLLRYKVYIVKKKKKKKRIVCYTCSMVQSESRCQLTNAKGHINFKSTLLKKKKKMFVIHVQWWFLMYEWNILLIFTRYYYVCVCSITYFHHLVLCKGLVCFWNTSLHCSLNLWYFLMVF